MLRSAKDLKDIVSDVRFKNKMNGIAGDYNPSSSALGHNEKENNSTTSLTDNSK